MKRSQFAGSPESDVLHFLHSTGLNLPIPRLIDSVTVDCDAYTVMTRLPGDTMLNLFRRKAITDEQIQQVVREVHAIVRMLWTLSPPSTLDDFVMCHPSGRGLPHALMDMEKTIGPLPLGQLYAEYTCRIATRKPWFPEDIIALEPVRMRKVLDDRIVYVHCDLRPLNIMVHNGEFSGIIDWENSGWQARHWQLFVLRTPLGWTNPEKLARWWKGVEFEHEVEEAYLAGWELVQHRV